MDIRAFRSFSKNRSEECSFRIWAVVAICLGVTLRIRTFPCHLPNEKQPWRVQCRDHDLVIDRRGRVLAAETPIAAAGFDAAGRPASGGGSTAGRSAGRF
ncbi:MAG: hypothetical protein HKM95_05020 [Inquilinus sp.]|nr:hypothetical protein [Inquilinus sp.]